MTRLRGSVILYNMDKNSTLGGLSHRQPPSLHFPWTFSCIPPSTFPFLLTTIYVISKNETTVYWLGEGICTLAYSRQAFPSSQTFPVWHFDSRNFSRFFDFCCNPVQILPSLMRSKIVSSALSNHCEDVRLHLVFPLFVQTVDFSILGHWFK